MTSPAELRRDLLLDRYVASFEKLDEMSANPDIYPFPGQLAIGNRSESGQITWRPLRTEPQSEHLEALYSRLPAKFPGLFERFLLKFRWAEVSLDTYTLMANPPGPDLDGFFKEISKDPGLWASLVPAGYLRFGKGPDMDYDPVCFDMDSRKKNREMRVVKIDHEEILSNRRIKVVGELAPTFEALVLQTISAANSR